MATQLLKRDTKCFHCLGAMKAGDRFVWVVRGAKRGGSRAAGVPERYNPAHPECDAKYAASLVEPSQAEVLAQAEAKIAPWMADLEAGRITTEQFLARLRNAA